MSLFSWLFRRNKAEEVSCQGVEEPGKKILTVNTDDLGEEGRKAVWHEISKLTDLSLFEGKVEHGYSQRVVSLTDQCPRCHGETQQYYANFIYATDIALRVMFAPAGFFCTECPSVIIDEEMISTGVKKGFRFHGVVGIDYDGKKEPDFFRTWNGKKTVYVLDENENVTGLTTIGSSEHDHAVSQISTKDRQKLKRKRQIAKRARKRNRNRR